MFTTLLDKNTPVKVRTAFAILIGVVLTGASYFVGYALGWINEVNYLEAFAVFTSYASTYLCVVESRVNYLFGIISTAAYCVLFGQFGLVASAIVNGYLAFSLVYGYFRWGGDENTKPVQHVALRWLPVYAVVTALAYLGALGITKAFGGELALTDSVILVGTILAQFLLDNKKIETWLVWVVVNVFAIYTYFSADLTLAGFQYVLFLANTVLGWVMWQKSMNADKKAYAEASADARANLKKHTQNSVGLGPDPLDPHGDGTIRKGDPMYDLMMGAGPNGIMATRNEDGTWKVTND